MQGRLIWASPAGRHGFSRRLVSSRSRIPVKFLIQLKAAGYLEGKGRDKGGYAPRKPLHPVETNGRVRRLIDRPRTRLGLVSQTAYKSSYCRDKIELLFLGAKQNNHCRC